MNMRQGSRKRSVSRWRMVSVIALAVLISAVAAPAARADWTADDHEVVYTAGPLEAGSVCSVSKLDGTYGYLTASGACAGNMWYRANATAHVTRVYTKSGTPENLTISVSGEAYVQATAQRKPFLFTEDPDPESSAASEAGATVDPTASIGISRVLFVYQSAWWVPGQAPQGFWRRDNWEQDNPANQQLTIGDSYTMEATIGVLAYGDSSNDGEATSSASSRVQWSNP